MKQKPTRFVVTWTDGLAIPLYHFILKNRSYREVDLHGLYVKEAIAHTDEAIAEAKKQGASELRLIVGN